MAKHPVQKDAAALIPDRPTLENVRDAARRCWDETRRRETRRFVDDLRKIQRALKM